MTFKLLYFVLLSVLITGCSGNTGSISRADNPPVTQLQTNITSGEIKIIRSNTTLKHGEMGFITIQGQPGVKYEIRTIYKVGNREIPVTQWRTADASGQATFNWVVSDQTAPGNHSAIISGNGMTLRVSHTVLPD